jgi:uncharacterized membrane protein YidH (DUF202 family)
VSDRDAPESSSTAAPDDEELPGLAGERTDMAWSRSGLAVVTCAAALLKRILTQVESATGRWWVFGLLLAGGAAWVAALAHARTVARSTIEGRLLADERVLRTTAMGTAALGGAALLLAI